MPTSPDTLVGSPGGSSIFNALDHHRIAQDAIPPRRPPRPSVDEPEHSSAWKGKRRSDASQLNRTQSYSLSSRTATASSMQVDHQLEHGDVRTLPPWIDSFEGNSDDFILSQATDRLLTAPPHARSAQHHFTPTKPERRRSQDGYVDSDDDASRETLTKLPERGFFGGSKEPERGRKWDHARHRDPVILQSGVTHVSSPWRTFVRSSMYGPAVDEDGKKVDEAFLNEQTPGYVRPWRGDLEGNDAEKVLGLRYNKKRRIWYRRIQNSILMHPLVPLAFRVVVLTTSTLALALSSSVYHLSNVANFPQNPSTIMAIIVDVVALPYIGYITWDEYKGKPLGLRSPKAKMRLLLLDLFFIVFESANLALAFEALTAENGSCVEGKNGTDSNICRRLKTLSGFLFIALVAWISTFNVSILRLIHRVGGRDEKN